MISGRTAHFIRLTNYQYRFVDY